MCSLPRLRLGYSAGWLQNLVDEAEFLRLLHVDEFVLLHEGFQCLSVSTGALYHEIKGALVIIFQRGSKLLEVFLAVCACKGVLREICVVDEEACVLVRLAF